MMSILTRIRRSSAPLPWCACPSRHAWARLLFFVSCSLFLLLFIVFSLAPSLVCLHVQFGSMRGLARSSARTVGRSSVWQSAPSSLCRSVSRFAPFLALLRLIFGVLFSLAPSLVWLHVQFGSMRGLTRSPACAVCWSGSDVEPAHAHSAFERTAAEVCMPQPSRVGSPPLLCVSFSRSALSLLWRRLSFGSMSSLAPRAVWPAAQPARSAGLPFGWRPCPPSAAPYLVLLPLQFGSVSRLAPCPVWLHARSDPQSSVRRMLVRLR